MGLYTGTDPGLQGVRVEPAEGIVPGLYDVWKDGVLLGNELTTNQVTSTLNAMRTRPAPPMTKARDAHHSQ